MGTDGDVEQHVVVVRACLCEPFDCFFGGGVYSRRSAGRLTCWVFSGSTGTPLLAMGNLSQDGHTYTLCTANGVHSTRDVDCAPCLRLKQRYCRTFLTRRKHERSENIQKKFAAEEASD